MFLSKVLKQPNQFDPPFLAKLGNLNTKAHQFESLGLTHFFYVSNELGIATKPTRKI